MNYADRPAKLQTLRDYALGVRSPLLLACSKCQRRLKRKGDPEALLPLKKLLKRIARRQGAEAPTLLKVPCLKLCPGDGLVILTPQQLGKNRCTILHTRNDAQALLAHLSAPKTHGAALKPRRAIVEDAEV